MNSGTDLAGTDGVYHHGIGTSENAGDRRNVADEIEIELIVERRVARVEATGHEQRIAVCGRVHDRLGADIAAAARPVLDDEWLAEPLRQPLTDQAREDVGRAGGRDRHDQTHRPRRVGLRPSKP